MTPHPIGAGDVVLITGGGSGIGLKAAQRFSERGAKVAVLDIDADATRASTAGTGALVVQCDVADRAAVQTAVDEVVTVLGPIKVVFANAGIHSGAADPYSLTAEAMSTMLDVNIAGVIWTIGATRPHLTEPSHIVVTASLSGVGPYSIDPLYSATKHAVVGFVRGLAPLLESQGVILNAIAPGIVDTPLVGADVVDLLKSVNFELLSTDDVIDAVDVALTDAQPGACYVSLPGMDPVPYRFRGLPGARVPLDDSSTSQ